MSTGKTYLKCKCPHCGAEVSYPDYAGGGASACGKCGKTVLLPRAAAAPQPAPAKPAASPAPTPKPAAPLPASKPAPALAPAPSASKPAPAPVKRVDPAAIRAVEPKPGGGRAAFLRVCLWTLNLAIVLAVVIVVGNHLKNRPKPAEGEINPAPPPTPSQPAPAASTPAAKGTSAVSPAPSTSPAPSPSPTPPMPAVSTPKGPKLLGDLKITQVALDQPKGAKGSRLVYVTGVLKNDSDHQRFGVRVELDLLDAAGTKVGTATDYRQMLEPRATWQFRAVVTDRRATAAKLAGVKEDE